MKLRYAVTCTTVVGTDVDNVVWAGVSWDQIAFGALRMEVGYDAYNDIIFDQLIYVNVDYGIKYAQNMRQYTDLDARLWLYVTYYDDSYIYLSRWQADPALSGGLYAGTNSGVYLDGASLTVLDTHVGDYGFVTIMFADTSNTDRASCKII